MSSPRVHAVAFAIVTLALSSVLPLGGCEQMNRPLGHPSGSSSSSSSGSLATPTSDVGDGGSGSPPPAFTAQPGDVQL